MRDGVENTGPALSSFSRPTAASTVVKRKSTNTSTTHMVRDDELALSSIRLGAGRRDARRALPDPPLRDAPAAALACGPPRIRYADFLYCPAMCAGEAAHPSA